MSCSYLTAIQHQHPFCGIMRVSNPSINHSAWPFVLGHCLSTDSLFSLSWREVRRPFVPNNQINIVLAPGVNHVPSEWSRCTDIKGSLKTLFFLQFSLAQQNAFLHKRSVSCINKSVDHDLSIGDIHDYDTTTDITSVPDSWPLKEDNLFPREILL